jgi:hypothetical protein
MWIEFPNYAQPAANDAAVVIAFFSPCNFQRPRVNILRVLEKLLRAKIPVFVVEAVYPDAPPLVLPADVNHQQIYVNWQSVLFLKENLFNIALKNTTHPKLVFMDGDVELSDPHWFNKTVLLLDTHDAVQPFEKCHWLDETNTKIIREKTSYAQAILEKTPVNGITQHPGFIWAARRDFLERVGGFYDRHAAGAGDLAFCHALVPGGSSSGLLQYRTKVGDYFADTNTYRKYQKTVENFAPRVTYLAGNMLQHFWHGAIDNRQYLSRYVRYVPELVDSEYQLIFNEQGILEWANPEHAIALFEYFKSRKEDG